MPGFDRRPFVNRERGEVALECRGMWLVLKIDYDTIARMIQEIGDDFDTRIASALDKYDGDTLCNALAICAQAHHPGLTAAEVRVMQPPFMPALTAMGDAMHAFMHGSAPEPASQDDAETKRAPLAGLLRFVGLWAWRSRRLSRQPSSGTAPGTS